MFKNVIAWLTLIACFGGLIAALSWRFGWLSALGIVGVSVAMAAALAWAIRVLSTGD